MGILIGPLQFIRELGLQPGFDVCELGDQWITCETPYRLAKNFYIGEMGADRYVSIDGNGRGTHTHDLNYKLPKTLGQFDLVTDFGTGEHVFNQAQVWASVHNLTRAGGHIVFDRPTQGYERNGGHCYYNSHICLFKDLAYANGYLIKRLEETDTTRGRLIRGVYQKVNNNKFVIPQQGRYKKLLRPIGADDKWIAKQLKKLEKKSVAIGTRPTRVVVRDREKA